MTNKSKIARPLPTQAELLALFDYCRITGDLTWRVSRGTAKAGDVAGTLHPEGYRCVKISGKLYKAHRIIWCMVTGAWPNDNIDHDNTVRSDNRWTNLREATIQENARNMRSRNPLGKGVRPKGSRFQACITINGKRTYLGNFKTAALAAEAYADAADKHFGEFARSENYSGVFARPEAER